MRVSKDTGNRAVAALIGAERAGARCVIVATSLQAACSGGGSPSSVDTTALGCSTGTDVVLIAPFPGSKDVTVHRHSIEIASSGAIVFSSVGLVAAPIEATGYGSGAVHRIVGPVPAPTPRPTSPPTPAPTPTPPLPFDNPVYYQASGFKLGAGQDYAVRVAALNGGCAARTIPNAQFKTSKRKS